MDQVLGSRPGTIRNFRETRKCYNQFEKSNYIVLYWYYRIPKEPSLATYINDKTRKLAVRILRNPKGVTLAELTRLCHALGGSVKETKSGGFLRVPDKTAFAYHNPHPGKFMKPGAVIEFCRCIDLAGLLIEGEKEREDVGDDED